MKKPWISNTIFSNSVDKIKIDGYLDSSSEDIAHAVTQIGNTINLFYNQGYLKDQKVIGAIVSSRHPSNDGTYRKAKQTLEKLLSSKITLPYDAELFYQT